MLLFVAGNETTANAISNAVLALIDHPDQCELARRTPALVDDVVEETLRYDAPVQRIFRTTTRAVEIAGATIPADAKVCCLIGSANRDGSRFADPDRFLVTRPRESHLAFGQGVHFCIGAPLARLETRVALGRLLARTSAIELDHAGTPRRLSTPLVRGFAHLPVRLHP